MNAIAVSLYDKFEDLSVLVDIIRHNWEDDYYISVCSNHPDAHDEISCIEHKIDYFEQGAQIRYEPKSSYLRWGNNLSFRIYDSIRTSCRAAFAKDDVEYVMHLHADAWPLDEQEFKQLLQNMKQREDSVAFPSSTHAFVENYPPGSFADNFIIFDANEAIAVDLFEHSPLELPPTWIHQIIPMLCVAKFGWDELYHYTNHAEHEHWDGTSSVNIANDARPMFHDPKFGQVHIAKEDFPSRLGKALQAYYLREYGITEGKHIQNLINEYEISEDELFKQLNDYLEDLNDDLRRYFLSVDSFGRDLRKVNQFLHEKSLHEKIYDLIDMKTENLFIRPLLEGISQSAKRLVTDGIQRPPESYNKYPNKFINDMYSQEIVAEDMPENLREDFRSTFER